MVITLQIKGLNVEKKKKKVKCQFFCQVHSKICESLSKTGVGILPHWFSVLLLGCCPIIKDCNFLESF
jgi:hypothetical protein